MLLPRRLVPWALDIGCLPVTSYFRLLYLQVNFMVKDLDDY